VSRPCAAPGSSAGRHSENGCSPRFAYAVFTSVRGSAGRGLDHLRSDQPECRRLQSDPRRCRAQYSAGNAGRRQLRRDDRRLSGDVGGSQRHGVAPPALPKTGSGQAATRRVRPGPRSSAEPAPTCAQSPHGLSIMALDASSRSKAAGGPHNQLPFFALKRAFGKHPTINYSRRFGPFRYHRSRYCPEVSRMVKKLKLPE
jgi:hypothetical protein